MREIITQAAEIAVLLQGSNIAAVARWRAHGSLNERTGRRRKPVVIKKYANRRLYNTATSSYVTLDDLSRMVKEGNDFVVYDAKTGEDITRAVLTQIIVEEEQKGQNLLPISFLRQLISLYGDSMQWLVPRYLEQAMVDLRAQPGADAQEPAATRSAVCSRSASSRRWASRTWRCSSRR